ncbi:MAG: helix-turn-helix domain-containing protein [Propionibacteriaceae bacterium]|nr:helix-turn-helix domain-containing protein [Propionibacteriaceae bacterium]
MDESSFRQDVARRVAQAMVAAGMSKTKLAQLACVPYATLDRKLRGGSDFSVIELMRIADVCSVRPHSLCPSIFPMEAAA